MLGTILGIYCAFQIPALAFSDNLNARQSSIFWLPLFVLLAGCIVGLLFTYTMGIGSIGVMIGGVVGFFIALFNGHFPQSLAFLLTTLAGFLVGQFLGVISGEGAYQRR